MALDFGAQEANTCGYDARWLSENNRRAEDVKEFK
jgi:hypothetical protein